MPNWCINCTHNPCPYDPRRPIKGTCSYCAFPIEMYEDVHYSNDDIVHKECKMELYKG